MPIYALIYHVCDNYVERRRPYRENHLKAAVSAYEEGLLKIGGALGEPVDRALLVFEVDDPSMVEQFARNDPYVINGLVQRWEIQPWHVVVGALP